MYKGHHISVIVPALNESRAIFSVVSELRLLTHKPASEDPQRIVDCISVCDNGSTDDTAERARAAGANKVCLETNKGYGAACLKAIEEINHTDILVFVNGDHSENIAQLPSLLDELIDKKLDLVIGSRSLGKASEGALLPQQIFGNNLAVSLMKLFWPCNYSDIGPFRAIRFDQYKNLHMQDRDYGWTIEMQIKATRLGYRVSEIPVDALAGMSPSKISGTLKGTIGAAYKIIGSILFYGLMDKFTQNEHAPAELALRKKL